MLLDPRWEKKIDAVPADEPWRKVLRDAADILEKKGWTRGAYKSLATGEYCAVGAIVAAATGNVGLPLPSYYVDTIQRLMRFLNQDSIEKWNDRMGPTGGEAVIRALRECADLGLPGARIVVSSSSWTGRP